MLRDIVDAMLPAYLDCALWASVDDDGNPLDDTHDACDVPEEARAPIRADIEGFLRMSHRRLFRHVRSGDASWDRIANDLFLSRNGHGAGFFHGPYGDDCDTLQALANTLGTSDPIVIGDGDVVFV